VDKNEFREKLMAAAAESGEHEVRSDPDFLNELCRVTGCDFSACKKRGTAPAGLFMTLSDPVVTDFFAKMFVKFPGLVKGVIHTRSVVDYNDSIRISGSYKERLSVKRVEEKQGKKGRYMAVDFEVLVVDDSGRTAARDLHQFFIRV